MVFFKKIFHLAVIFNPILWTIPNHPMDNHSYICIKNYCRMQPWRCSPPHPSPTPACWDPSPSVILDPWIWPGLICSFLVNMIQQTWDSASSRIMKDSLEVNPILVELWHSCSPSSHPDCRLLRNHEAEIPSKPVFGFLTDRNHGKINVFYFQPLCLE